jgi:hypothetical protein
MTRKILLVLFIGAIGFQAIKAQDFKKEARQQIPVLLKALNHNYTLKDRIKKECVIAVLYNPQSTASDNEKSVISDALNDNKKLKVHDKKIKIIELPLHRRSNLEKQIIIRKINAFWLTADLEHFRQKIQESARFNQVITIASDPELVINSTALMSTRKSGGIHKLVINKNMVSHNKLKLNDQLYSDAIVLE